VINARLVMPQFNKGIENATHNQVASSADIHQALGLGSRSKEADSVEYYKGQNRRKNLSPMECG